MNSFNKIIAPFGKSGNIYLLGAVAQGLSPLLLTPFLTRTITKESFGQLTFLNSFSLIFSVLLSLGIPLVISRSYVLEKKNTPILDKLINKYILLSLIFSFLLFLLYVFTNLTFLIFIATFFLYAIYQIGLPSLRARGFANRFALYSVVNTFFGNLTVLLFINTINNIYILYYIGTLISSFIAYLLIYKKSNAKISLNFLLSCIKIGLPVVPHMLAMIALVNIDKVIFAIKSNDVNTGFLQILLLIGLSPIFIISALNHAWLNQVLEQLQDGRQEALKSINKTVLNLFYLSFLFITLIFLLKDMLITFLNPYIEITSNVTGSIVIALASSFLYIIYLANTHILTWKKKFWVLGITSPLAVILQSLTIYLLINEYNFISAAIAFGVALTTQVLLVEFYFKIKKYPKILDLKYKIFSLVFFWSCTFIFINIVNP